MADLGFSSDEIRWISKRFGKGATNIDRYSNWTAIKPCRRPSHETDDLINEVKTRVCGRGGAASAPG